MTQDESESLSGLSAQTESLQNESTSPDGVSSQATDPDLKPIGRCFNELNRLRAAAKALSAANAEVEAASAAFWACRDAAMEAMHTRQQFECLTFKAIAPRVEDLESMIEILSK